MTFSVDDLPDLSGKVAIVTGGNTGIGKETGLALARKGAHVYLACRSKERAMPAVEEIKKESNNNKVEFIELDLGSLKSVKECAKEFLGKEKSLHLLINNAGIMALPNYELTKDGVEAQYGTNVLGHFYFTLLLLPILKESVPSRIINLSSSAHQMAPKEGILFDHLQNQKSNKYSPWGFYGQSKLGNILFTRALNKRLEEEKVTQLYVNSVHPGVVNTELGRNMPWYVQIVFKPAANLFFLTPAKGALTSLYCAGSKEIEEKNIKNKYFVPIAKESKTTDKALDDKLADQLWDWNMKIIDEKIPNAFV